MYVPFTAFSFFFYVFWLLAVPMEGPLLILYNAGGKSHWFLIVHVAVLAILGRWTSSSRLGFFARIGAAATALLTLLLPLSGEFIPLSLAFLGLTAAPMAIKACSDLHSARNPIRTAAWCLVGANLMLAVVQATVNLSLWPTFLAILPLLTMPAVPHFAEGVDNTQPLNRSYLAFVFIFQIVSGLMYASLYPAYAEYAFLTGLELPFYMTASLVAVIVYQRDRDMLLAGALILAMLAFALLQVSGGMSINISMFTMQISVGCIDMFLLALLLTSTRSVATFGYGLAVFCGGIAAGQFLCLALGPSSALAGLAGGLVLNIAALSLFLRRRHKGRLFLATEAEATQSVLPTEFSSLLSERELKVLSLVLAGKSYREAALELTLSESTIKTYMKRIFDKHEVPNRLELLRKIGQATSG